MSSKQGLKADSENRIRLQRTPESGFSTDLKKGVAADLLQRQCQLTQFKSHLLK